VTTFFTLIKVFKQASCVPDAEGLCPTSILLPSEEEDDGGLIPFAFLKSSSTSKSSTLERGSVKVWLKCGKACWQKTVHFGPGELPDRYKEGNDVCPREDFPDLCEGRCKFYDAWFCAGELICTDRPCKGRCHGQGDDILPPERR